MGPELRRHIFLLLFFLVASGGIAQQLNLPLHHTFNIGWERVYSDRDSLAFHSGFKPIIENENLSYTLFQQGNKTQVTKHFAWLFKDKNWFKRKAKWENLYAVEGPDFYFDVNPLFNLEYGRDLANDNSLKFNKNGRGVLVNGHITKKFSFSTSFMENQMYLPTYIRNYSAGISTQYYNGALLSSESPVVPGQGRAKLYKTNAYDFAWAQGYLSFSPVKNMNIQYGNNKLFVGEGYRSVLLSDNAFSFPHLRFTGHFFKQRLQYTFVHASLQNMIRMKYYSSPEALFEKKAANFMYASFSVSPKLQIALFEGSIWRRTTEEQKLLPVDYSFYNPLIGFNLARFGFRHPDHHSLVGLNFKYQPFARFYLYAQLATDGPADGRWAYQLGAKSFDAFAVKNLFLQVEINHAARNMYTGVSGRENYGHYNQPLALTTGAGTFETLLRAYYRTDDFFYEVKLHYQTYRYYDASPQWGKDIYLPENAVPDASVLTGMSHLIYKDISFGYMLNPLYNMHMVIGWFHRDLRQVSLPYKTSYLYIGFRTSLSNFYYDI